MGECSALPHTVSQDLHANHEGKQPRSRHGDRLQLGWQPGCVQCSVCTVCCRLASPRLVLVSSRLAAASAPHLRHAPALQWLTFFFLRRGIPEDRSVAASA